MTANAVNRKTARLALATLLEAKVKTLDGLVQSVYPYKKSNLKGESPVLLVMSAGSLRVQHGMGTPEKYDSAFRLAIMWMVIDAKDDESWTDANVESALDDIEKSVADCIADHRGYVVVTQPWTYLKHDENPSSIMNIRDVKGVPYQAERLVVIVRAHD